MNQENNRAKPKKERVGMDALNIVFAVLAAVLIGAGFGAANLVPFVIAAVLVVLFLFRALSGNAEKRRSENQTLVDAWNAVRRWFKLQGLRWKDRKEYVYKTCPKCRHVLRVKRSKGSRDVTCPYCSTKVKVAVHFGKAKENSR